MPLYREYIRADLSFCLRRIVVSGNADLSVPKFLTSDLHHLSKSSALSISLKSRFLPPDEAESAAMVAPKCPVNSRALRELNRSLKMDGE